MQMHIGTCTKQNHEFLYRRPSHIKVLNQTVPAGGQIKIEGSREELDFIVSQHERYGLIEARSFSRAERFSGMVFSMNGPINVEAIMAGIEHHDESIDRIAQEARENSAAAIDTAITDKAGSAQAQALNTTVEIVEQPKDQADTGKKMSQKLVIDATTRGRGRQRPN